MKKIVFFSTLVLLFFALLSFSSGRVYSYDGDYPVAQKPSVFETFKIRAGEASASLSKNFSEASSRAAVAYVTTADAQKASFISSIRNAILNFLGFTQPDLAVQAPSSGNTDADVVTYQSGSTIYVVEGVTRDELEQSINALNVSLQKQIYALTSSGGTSVVNNYYTTNTTVTSGVAQGGITGGLARAVSRTTRTISGNVSEVESDVDELFVLYNDLSDSFSGSGQWNVSGSDAYRLTGNVGIGTATPLGKLHVFGASSGVSSASSFADDLVIENSSNAGLSLLNASGVAFGSIFFGDSADNDIGKIEYYHGDDSLQFTTNNSEKMRITSAGNVGINTVTPNAGQLQVNGSAAMGGKVLTLTGASTGGTTDNDAGITLGLGFNSSGNRQLVVYDSDSIGHSDQFGFRIAPYTGGTSNRIPILDAISGNGAVVGNLSIGQSGSLVGIGFDAGQAQSDIKSKLSVRGNASIGSTYIGTAAPTDGLIVEGNVGIGTTTPTAKLDLHNSTNSSNIGDIRIVNPNTGTSAYSNIELTTGTANQFVRLHYINPSFTTSGTNIANSALLAAGTGATGGLVFRTDAAAPIIFATNGTANERMRIDSSGNVGIGTVSPGSRLHVVSGTTGNTLQGRFENSTGGEPAGFRMSNGGWDIGFRTIPSVAWFDISDSAGLSQHQWSSKNYYLDPAGAIGFAVSTLSPTAAPSYDNAYFNRGGANTIATPGNLTIGGTASVSGAASVNGGTLSMANGSANRLIFANTGVAGPSSGAASAGEKIVFYGDSSATKYAMGIDSNTLWQQTDVDFKWYEDTTQRMVLTGGNLGIATATPSARLAVTGAGTGTGVAFRVANSSNVSKFSVLDNGNTSVAGNLNVTGSLASSGIVNTGGISTTGSYSHDLSSGNSFYLYNANWGHDVFTVAERGRGYFTNNSNGTAFTIYNNDNTGNCSGSCNSKAATILALSGSAAQTGNLQTWDVNGTSRGRFTAAGDLSIGSVAPLGKLTVYNSASSYYNFSSSTGQFTIRQDGGTRPRINLTDTGGFGEGYLDFYTYSGQTVPTIRWAGIDTGAYTGAHVFYTSTGGSPSQPLAERMRITGDGKVGIGSSNPTAKLEVLGAGGGGSGTSEALALTGGNTNAYFGNSQITFGYNGSRSYMHAIKTRHNSGGAANNAIDFFVWNQGVDAAEAVGTKHVMTLDGTGYVGIGVTTPTAKLHVEDTTDGGRVAYYRSNAASSPNTQFVVDSPSGFNSGVVYQENATDKIGLFYNANTTSGNRLADTFELYSFVSSQPIIRVSQSAGNTLNIDASGNVGIGTASPNARLDVLALGGEGSVTYASFGRNSTLNTLDLYFDSTSRQANIIRSGYGDLAFSTVAGTGAATAVEKMRITTDGNIGIGTTNPGAKLEVNGGGANVIQRLFSGGAGNFAYLTLGRTAEDLEFGVAGADAQFFSDASQGSGILKQVNSSGNLMLGVGSGASSMTLINGGNIGIGTTSPAARLHVVASVSQVGVFDSSDSQTYFAIRNNNVDKVFLGYADSAGFMTDSGAGFKIRSNDGFYVGTNGDTSTTRLGILPDGSVGIGTANPTQEFTVYGSGSNSTEINIIEPDGASESIINFGDSLTGSDRYVGRISYDHSSNSMRFSIDGNNASPEMIIDNGYLGVKNLGSASANDLCFDTTTTPGFNTFTTCSSASKYKENITDFSFDGLETINALRAVEFDWKDDGVHDFGFVAEEVEAVDPLFASYYNGELEGVKYKQLTALLVKGIQEMYSALFVKIEDGVAHLKEVWFDGKVHVNNELCVDDVCVTKDEFKSLLLEARGDNAPAGNGGSDFSDSPDASDLPDSSEDNEEESGAGEEVTENSSEEGESATDEGISEENSSLEDEESGAESSSDVSDAAPSESTE
jgi:hypothetical protein